MLKYKIIQEVNKADVLSTLMKRHWPQKEQKQMHSSKEPIETRTHLTRNPESLVRALNGKYLAQ